MATRDPSVYPASLSLPLSLSLSLSLSAFNFSLLSSLYFTHTHTYTHPLTLVFFSQFLSLSLSLALSLPLFLSLRTCTTYLPSSSSSFSVSENVRLSPPSSLHFSHRFRTLESLCFHYFLVFLTLILAQVISSFLFFPSLCLSSSFFTVPPIFFSDLRFCISILSIYLSIYLFLFSFSQL